MVRLKATLNTPHVKAWLEPIGKLALNFSAIEMQTYLWLGDLAPDQSIFPGAVDWRFKQRVDTILSFVDSEIADAALKAQCSHVWHAALDAAKFRNSILHNPIVFGWSTKSEQGPPDFIGVPDVGHLGQRQQITKKIATLADINARINEGAAIASDLFAFREAYTAQRQASSAAQQQVQGPTSPPSAGTRP